MGTESSIFFFGGGGVFFVSPRFRRSFPMGRFFFMFFLAFWRFLVVEFDRNTPFGTKEAFFYFLAPLGSPTSPSRVFFVLVCFFPFLPLLSSWVVREAWDVACAKGDVENRFHGM